MVLEKQVLVDDYNTDLHTLEFLLLLQLHYADRSKLPSTLVTKQGPLLFFVEPVKGWISKTVHYRSRHSSQVLREIGLNPLAVLLSQEQLYMQNLKSPNLHR